MHADMAVLENGVKHSNLDVRGDAPGVEEGFTHVGLRSDYGEQREMREK